MSKVGGLGIHELLRGNYYIIMFKIGTQTCYDI